MKLNLHDIYNIDKNSVKKAPQNFGVKKVNTNIKLDEFMKNIISKIKQAKTSLDADRYLYDLSHSSDQFETLEECFKYRHQDFNIITCLDYVGKPIINNLKKVNDLDISIAPKLVGAISKDKKIYIVTQNPGMQSGNLKPYFVDGMEKVSAESKLTAYKDMQKLTKAGYVDDANLRGGSWSYTPRNEILLPNWSNLRQIRPDESAKEIMEQYYKIIFGN